jgi:hypothetical protein
MTDRPATLDDVLRELRAIKTLLRRIDDSTWRAALEAGIGGCSIGDGPVEVVIVEPSPATPKRARARKAPAKA